MQSNCHCGAVFNGATQQACDEALKEHGYAYHDVPRPSEPTTKENETMEPEQTEQTPQPQAQIAAPPNEMVDMVVMQLEGILSSVAVPDYVREAAQGFIDALKKWAAGGN